MKSMNYIFKSLLLIVLSATTDAGPVLDKVAAFQEKLMPSRPGGGGNIAFGSALDVQGDLAVVSGSRHYGTGAVYVYEKNNQQWLQTAELRPKDLIPNDDYGYDAILAGDKLFVSAMNKVIDGIQGVVYVFQLINGVWEQTQVLRAPVGDSESLFGFRMFFFEGELFIASDVGSIDSRVYVYRYLDQSWQLSDILQPPNPHKDATLGYAITRVGDQLLVSEPTSNNFAGEVLVFEKVNGEWVYSDAIRPPGSLAGSAVGASINHNKSGLFLGAVLENQGDDQFVGAVYHFAWVEPDWVFQQKLSPSALNANAQFGFQMAADDSHLYVSSRNLINSTGIDDGAIHVFDLNAGLNQVDLLRSDNPDYNQRYASDFVLENDRLVVAAASHNNHEISTFGKVYELDVNNGLSVISEIKGPPGSSYVRLGRNMVASGDWMMVDRYFRSDDSQSWIYGVEIFQKSTSGWVSTQSIKDMSNDNLIRMYIRSLDDDVALITKSESNEPSLRVYRLNDMHWTFEQVLEPSVGLETNGFGVSTDVDVNRIVVGHLEFPLSADQVGGVFVFEYDGQAWVETALITPTHQTQIDHFGRRVALSGDFLAVGSETVIANETIKQVDVFRHTGAEWTHHQTINTFNQYSYDTGEVIQISADWLLIREVTSSGFNQPSRGVVRVFAFEDGDWLEKASLSPEAFEDSRFFGNSFDIQGQLALVGQSDPFGNDLAHLFQLDKAGWYYLDRIDRPNYTDWSQFAKQVAFVNEGVVISAPDDSQRGNSSGAVYAYNLVSDLIFTDHFQ